MNDSAAPPNPDGADWRRVHRVTPLLNAWKVAVAIVAIVIFQGFDDLAGADVPLLLVVGIVAGVVVVASLVSLAYSYLAWRRMTYTVTSDAVVLRSGVLFRRERFSRLTRIQSVEITQPLLGRIFGFSALHVESAGGSGHDLTISYLTHSEASAVRNEVLARAAGLEVGPDVGPNGSGGPAPASVVSATSPRPPLPALPDAQAGERARGAAPPSGDRPRVLAPEAPERQVFELDPSRLLCSLLLHGVFVALMVGVTAVVVLGLVTGSWEYVLPSGAGLLGAGAFLWSRFASEFAFRVAISPDGLRVRAGLLATTARTIPPDRIQSVTLAQGPLWRLTGWWRVRVSLASTVSSSESGKDSSALLPVGTSDEALAMVRLAIADLGEDELDVLREGMTGTGDAQGWVPSPRRAVWVDPIAYRRNAFRALRGSLALRRRRVFRELTLVPHARTQSLGIEQGPVDRMLNLVVFRPHTAGGDTPRLPHIDPAVAATLLHEQSERARAARRAAGPERWMRDH